MADPVIGRQATPVFEDLPDASSLEKFKQAQKASPLRPGRTAQPVIPDTGQTISAQDPMSYVRQGMSYLRGIGTATAGGLGAAGGAGAAINAGQPELAPYAAVGGRAFGSFVSDQLYQQLLQRAAPAIFGNVEEDFPKSLAESGVNTAVDLFGSEALPRAYQAMKSGIPSKLFKPNPLGQAAEDLPALAANPNFKTTVGQATGNRTAQIVENLFGGQKLRQIQAGQQRGLTQSAENFLQSISHGATTLDTPTARLAETSAQAAETLASRNRNIQNALYQHLEQGVLPNETATVAVPTGQGSNYWNMQSGWNNQFKNAEVQGPIRLRHSIENAVKLSNSMDELINDPTNVFSKGDLSEINDIKSKVDSFTQNNLAYDKDGNSIISYKLAKALKSGELDLFNKLPDEAKQRLKGSIASLKAGMGQDMYESVHGNPAEQLPAMWSQQGQVAYDAANAKYKSNLSRFSPDFAKRLAAGEDPDIIKQDVMNSALNSVQQMKQYKATLDPSASEPLSLLAKNVLNQARGTTGIWDGGKALETLKQYTDSGVAQEAFANSKQLQGFKYMLQNMRTATPSTSDIGKITTAARFLGATAGLASGALVLTQTGHMPASMATSGIIAAAIPLTEKIVQSFMLDPVNARRLAGIATSPPSSITAQNTIRQIIKSGMKTGALKGVVIDLMDQNQRKVGQGTFDNNGNLIPINSQQQ